jgi:ABC-type transport system involved in multi-copper enzyme maturation permease subunit
MLGTIVNRELAIGDRRSRLRGSARVIALLLALQFGVLFLVHELERGPHTGQGLGRLVNSYFSIFILETFLLLWLAAPVLVGGVIAGESTRGTLELLLATDVTAAEIIVGKLVAALSQLFHLALVGLPLLCFIAGYGTLGWPIILAVALLVALTGFFMAALTIWSSARSRTPREAAVRVYLWTAVAASAVALYLNGFFSGWLIRIVGDSSLEFLSQIEGTVRCLNPVHVLDAIWGDAHWQEFSRRLRIAALVYGGLGALFVLLATNDLRRSVARQRSRATTWLWLRSYRPPVSDHPIRWRERWIGQPFPNWIGVPIVAGLTVIASWWNYPNGGPLFFFLGNGLAFGVATLAVAIRASASIAGERERGTWDGVLLTPIETSAIVKDLVHGTLESTYPYLFAYAIPSLLFNLLVFNLPVSRATFIGSVTVLLLAWFSMMHVSAIGVLCSARSQDSWSGLIGTLTRGYAALLGFLSLTAIVIFLVGCTGSFLVVVLFNAFAATNAAPWVDFIGSCAAGCGFFGWAIWRLLPQKLKDAEKIIDTHDRYASWHVW